MDMEPMTVQDLLRNEALKNTEGMTLEEITCYADQVLAIARERAQREVALAEEALHEVRRLRDYADSIGK